MKHKIHDSSPLIQWSIDFHLRFLLYLLYFMLVVLDCHKPTINNQLL